MENASKALLIAGAILIAILLISVAILVMNSTTSVQDEMESNMNATQKQAFNAQFTNYQGTGKRAADVRSLYSAVNSSNTSHDSSAQVTLTITGAASGDAMSNTIANLSTRHRYTIVVNISDTTGLVDTITVTQAP